MNHCDAENRPIPPSRDIYGSSATPKNFGQFSPLCIALDLPDSGLGLEIARKVMPHAGMLKVGLEAFVAHGQGWLAAVCDLGLPVFLDLKLHDIPRTVEAAARAAADFGVRLLTVHGLGGSEMIEAAMQGAGGRCSVVAVTVLTSHNEASLQRLGLEPNPANCARNLGALALDAGADGLVCAASDLKSLADLGGIRVVPGIRPSGAAHGDQKRVATPAEAQALGATWLVVGRPVVASPDPAQAASDILHSLKQGTAS